MHILCTIHCLQVLQYTAGHINMGGRVTDDWDRRCIMNILNDFYSSKVLDHKHTFSESGIYHQMQPDNGHQVYKHHLHFTIHSPFSQEYLTYIRSLPINDTPEIFGLHDNANITFALNDTFNLFSNIVKLQPKSSSSGGLSREEVRYCALILTAFILAHQCNRLLKAQPKAY